MSSATTFGDGKRISTCTSLKDGNSLSLIVAKYKDSLCYLSVRLSRRQMRYTYSAWVPAGCKLEYTFQ
jgi:hypothetical protein